jgi:hypothetical protein
MNRAESPSISEDQLFALLGEEILSSSKMGGGVSDNQKTEFGRNWFRSHLADIQRGICGNGSIEDLATKSDTAQLVAAMAPLLGFSPVATASTTLAVLIARIGVRRICADEWS